MTYKSTTKTIEQIGRELGVSYILEGSARRAGDRIRITAQLIQVSDQTHIWADNFETGPEDVLSIQSRVARAVAAQTQVKLNVEEEEPRRVVAAAYEAFSRGRYLWNRRTREDLETSLHSFQEAVRIDPSYAAAYAGMADVYLTLMDHGYLSPRGGSAQALRVVDIALRLDDSLAEAHVSRGHAAFHEFDWENAERGFRRGLELNPNYSIGHFYYANHRAAMAAMDDAIAEAEKARELDPVSPAAQSNLSSILWLARQYERSIDVGRHVLELSPAYAGGYEDLGRNFEQLGHFDEAESAFRQAATLAGESAASLASLGHLYGLAGRQREANEILQKLEALSKTKFVGAYALALVCLGLERYDDTFRWLEQAYEERSSALPVLNVNPRFDRVRGDPRLTRLIEQLGLPR